MSKSEHRCAANYVDVVHACMFILNEHQLVKLNIVDGLVFHNFTLKGS